jgi:hypothetical protein
VPRELLEQLLESGVKALVIFVFPTEFFQFPMKFPLVLVRNSALTCQVRDDWATGDRLFGGLMLTDEYCAFNADPFGITVFERNIWIPAGSIKYGFAGRLNSILYGFIQVCSILAVFASYYCEVYGVFFLEFRD